MFIIVEGLDRTGKTTLTTTLEKKYGLPRQHFSKPSGHPLNEYVKPLESGVPHMVCDRYHLGERVWPKIFGRDSEYDDAMHHYTELALLSRGAFLIHTTRRYRSEGELAASLEGEPISPTQYRRAEQLFGREMFKTLLPRSGWTLTGGETRPIRWHAKELAHAARRLSRITPRWVGHTDPNVLLVGDEVGPSSKGWTLPFVPYKNTSGHFLMDQLRLIPQVKPAIVNSIQPDGDLEDVSSLWEELGRPPVVALGNHASRRLREERLEHSNVFHPQYVRRFLRKNGTSWYAHQLRNASGFVN